MKNYLLALKWHEKLHDKRKIVRMKDKAEENEEEYK